ncbi:DUF3465 domain-containing protein [Kiritimatiellaeota bacterium B1221]|nr:DUF3465 domain-containing protein [Kiritimatiellaeota bacterium B1221]
MKRGLKRSPVTVVLLLLMGLYLAYQEGELWFQKDGKVSTTTSSSRGDAVHRAYDNRQSDVQVSGKGEIIKVLPDDTQGSRHQKFLLDLGQGLTILIAHNIDLAPRVPSIREGDTIGFQGEYEWTDKGGVVHWTHHDPAGRHPGGWLEFQGKRYQ